MPGATALENHAHISTLSTKTTLRYAQDLRVADANVAARFDDYPLPFLLVRQAARVAIYSKNSSEHQISRQITEKNRSGRRRYCETVH